MMGAGYPRTPALTRTLQRFWSALDAGIKRWRLAGSRVALDEGTPFEDVVSARTSGSDARGCHLSAHVSYFHAMMLLTSWIYKMNRTQEASSRKKVLPWLKKMARSPVLGILSFTYVSCSLRSDCRWMAVSSSYRGLSRADSSLPAVHDWARKRIPI